MMCGVLFTTSNKQKHSVEMHAIQRFCGCVGLRIRWCLVEFQVWTSVNFKVIVVVPCSLRDSTSIKTIPKISKLQYFP